MIKKSQLNIMNLFRKNIFLKKTIREISMLLKKDYPNTYNAIIELEKEGLIKKKISAKQFPIKSEYSLSESGADLIRIIKEMKKWALHWKINNAYCEKTNCKLCEF